MTRIGASSMPEQGTTYIYKPDRLSLGLIGMPSSLQTYNSYLSDPPLTGLLKPAANVIFALNVDDLVESYKPLKGTFREVDPLIHT